MTDIEKTVARLRKWYAEMERSADELEKAAHSEPSLAQAAKGNREVANVLRDAIVLITALTATAMTDLQRLGQEADAGVGRREWNKPPAHWTPTDKYDRHPKTPEAWDRFADPTGKDRNECAIRRLNFAADLKDPDAPDQMAIVHRGDLIDVLGHLITQSARAELWLKREDATPSPVALDREALARVIDPASWRSFDSWMQPVSGISLSDTLVWRDKVERATQSSLAKADEIIALSLSAASGWRDIATAERGKARIDLWTVFTNHAGIEHGERLCGCRWRNESATYQEGWHDAWGNRIEWRVDPQSAASNGQSPLEGRRVTHWMPISLAPAVQHSGEKTK